MKELKFKKDAKLVPARNRVLLFTNETQTSLEGERVMAQLGCIAPLLSRGVTREELINHCPDEDRNEVVRILDLLCRRGVVVESESAGPRRKKPEVSEPNVTFIGHATLLIKTCGLHVLTDPWLFIHDKHIDHQPYPVTFEDLPPIDLICISHMHGDHMHLPTLLRLNKKIPVVVPKIEKVGAHNRNLESMLAGLNFENIFSLSPWETFSVGDLRVTRTPCHMAWTITEQATWLIESPEMTLFCGGDMFEDEQFMRHLGSTRQIDVAFLPISGYAARIGQSPLKELMPPETHEQIYRDVMGVSEAVQATRWIKPKFAVGYANGGAYWYKHPECSITGGGSQDFVAQLREENPSVRGVDMRPGDVWEHKAERLHRDDPPA